MLIAANKQLTSSIREHDAETADYLEFLGHKMRQDLTKQIESRIEPIRFKMFNKSSKMIGAKYNFMVKRARKNIIRKYKNSITNSIAYMNYKKLKAGGKQVEIHRDSDGNWVCTPFCPSTPMSQPSTFRIDSKHDAQQHSDSPSSDDTDSSEAMDLSNSEDPARPSAAIDVAPSNLKVTLAKKRRTLSPNRCEAQTLAKKRRTLSPNRCEARQCEKNEDMAFLDFTDNPRHSYTKNASLSMCM